MNDITEVFKDAVVKAVEERVKGDVVVTQVLKNNGVRLTGLILRDKSKSVSPTFYLESIRPEHRSIERIDAIADEIAGILTKPAGLSCGDSKSTEPGCDDGTDGTYGTDGADVAEKIQQIITSPKELKTRVFPRVINYDWNTELLQTLPHRRFLDLAITYDIEVGKMLVPVAVNKMLRIL